MPIPEPVRSALVPAAWFTALALAVAGPLLGAGYLLLLDWPSGPQFPRVDFFPAPTSGDIGNSAPLNALHAGLRAIHQYLPDKLFLMAPIVLGGIGVYRLVRSRLGIGAWEGILGGTLFVVNPWVIDRYLSGHLYILLAYSLLPWAVLPLFDAMRDEPSLRSALATGGWLFALGVIDLHVAGMYALLATVSILASPSPRRWLHAGAALGVAAVASSWWLIPAVLTPPTLRVGPADLAVYAPRPGGYEVLPHLAAMYGFWRDEFVGPAGRVPALYLILFPMLGLVAVGVFKLVASGPHRRFAFVLGGTAIVALLLAAGTVLPLTAGAFRWIFDHVFAFRIYREPQKFLGLLILAYAVFAAVGPNAMATRWARWGPGAVAGVAVVGVLAYGYTLFWGFWDQVHLSHYPRDWYVADRTMTQEGMGERVLVLPWELYAVWSFSDGRIVANPAPSFFSQEMLVNPEAGFVSVPIQSTDPDFIRVTRRIGESVRTHNVGRVAGCIRVGSVLLLHEIDHWNYRHVRKEQELIELLRLKALTLFNVSTTLQEGVAHGAECRR